MVATDPAGGETPEAEEYKPPPGGNYSLMLPTDPPQTATGTTFTGWQMKRTKGGWGQHWRKDW